MGRQAHRLLLAGSSHDAGKTLGRIVGGIPDLIGFMKLKEPFLSRQEEKEMLQLFDEFCPGLNE